MKFSIHVLLLFYSFSSVQALETTLNGPQSGKLLIEQKLATHENDVIAYRCKSDRHHQIIPMSCNKVLTFKRGQEVQLPIGTYLIEVHIGFRGRILYPKPVTVRAQKTTKVPLSTITINGGFYHYAEVRLNTNDIKQREEIVRLKSWYQGTSKAFLDSLRTDVNRPELIDEFLKGPSAISKSFYRWKEDSKAQMRAVYVNRKGNPNPRLDWITIDFDVNTIFPNENENTILVVPGYSYDISFYYQGQRIDIIEDIAIDGDFSTTVR